MEKHYAKKDSPAYSPKGVRDLFEQAVDTEGGSIEAVLSNKHKYKALLELWHASFLAFALNKWLKRKFYLTAPEQDPPDVLFIDPSTDEAFPVELMELFDYGQTSFDGDYERLVKKIVDVKGSIRMPLCHLLLISRINSTTFDVSKLLKELKKTTWGFERIWLAGYTAANLSWAFFELFPFTPSNIPPHISISTKNPDDMKYFY